MNRNELIKTLEVVSRGLSNNTLVPTFGYFCFTGKTVFSWNDSIAVVGLCKVDKPFGCHGQTLLGLLKACSGEAVEFSVTKEHLEVVCGSSDFKLPYITQDEFVWKEPEILNAHIYPYSYMATAISTCLLTCSDDVALGAFNQICLGEENGQLVIYSCDGDSITKATTDIHMAVESCCLSKSLCVAIHQVWDYTEVWTVNDFTISKEWISASFDQHFSVYGHNLGLPSLDYEAEIRKSVGVNDLEFVPIPAELNNALSRARVVADKETKPTKLIIDGGTMDVHTEAPQGDIWDSMPCIHPGTLEVKVSAAMLQRALDGCNQWVVTERCVVLRGERILRLCSNLGE